MGFLLLSDLHSGLEDQKWFWPAVEKEFLDDLKHIVDQCGSIDLVLFTGDLTQAGKREQFDKANEILQGILDRLRGLGSTPLVLAVPGNHDLQRPEAKSDAERLQKWDLLPELREEFWRAKDCSARVLVDLAFKEYKDWWENRRPQKPKPGDEKTGVLPGDFAITIPVGDSQRLGIMGLNTAFRQLGDGDYNGKISIHPAQFNALNPSEWMRDSDIRVLLTHHPSSWFDPESLGYFNTLVYRPNQFGVHLYGHLHEPNLWTIASRGGEQRQFFTAPSLFGGKDWTNWSDNKPMPRLHGFAAGRLSLAQDGTWELRFWPRLANPELLWVYPDHRNFRLSQSDHGTVPIPIRSMRRG